MMMDFYEAFGNNANEDTKIPTEILEELNKELPSNLTYFQDGNGRYRIVPKPDRKIQTLKMTTMFDFDPEKDSLLIERLKSVPQDKWAEYLYRTQKSIAVKNVRIGDNEQLIPLEQTLGNPLSDEKIICKDCKMYPAKFPNPTPMMFESEEGDKVCINFQQEAYDSLTEIKIHNVDFPALKIDLYIYQPLVDISEETAKTSKNNQFIANYSVTPTNAPSVSEALTALRFFKGIFTGKTKINGQSMISSTAQVEFDKQGVEDALHFWSTAAKLEKKLDVNFIPNADFPTEDVKFFSELDVCLNENKKIIWKHPFNHFHINGYHPHTEEGTPDAITKCDGLHFQFIEGPIPCTLLGTEFEIYSFSEMDDLITTNIEWDDEEKQNGEMYISDAPGKTWTLKRLYMTKDDMDKFKENLKQNKKSGSKS